VHSCQELKITQTEQQLELKKALDRQKHLIDAELFEEEINNLQALVLSTNKASGQKSDKTVGVSGSGPPQKSQPRRVGGGGLSIQEKQKFKEMCSSVERL